MAAVTPQIAYLSLAATPSVYVQLSTAAKVESPLINGNVNAYAANRQRLVVVNGITDSDDLTFTLVNRATRKTLRSWIGQTVCYRDPHGTKIFGAYLTLKSTEEVGANVADVELTLLTVSFSELN